MPIPGLSDQEHYHGHVHSQLEGNPIFGDNILISGGFFSFTNYVCPSSQQQVLDILYPRAGPSRIDVRLLHNSNEYEDVRLGGSHILREVMNHLPKRDALRHGLSYYIRKGSSKLVSIAVAEHLASEGNLLATIILPDSAPPCTKFIVATLAYQLVQNIPSSAEYVLAALQHDPGIFGRNTETQFKELFMIPLEKAHMSASTAEKLDWPNTIVLDGNEQELAPGSVGHRLLQSFSALPVNTITLIEIASRPCSLAQRFQNIVLQLIYRLRS
ncbi:hypothetical protein D9619_001955 [Psilocybe cf. subviscida]|uniref:Uncharacterized protein n=1 Tax=Psilocybe cf. subviscida TaxID=2480587 RepID=A0A8H5BES6_9AGAR|nr:hypothetical protein D9619_001955 [Psilocybe cf. subviscida]